MASAPIRQYIARFCAVLALLTAVTVSSGQRSSRTPFPWADQQLSPDTRADLVLHELTLDEKIQMLHGMGWPPLLEHADAGPATRAISVWAFIPGIPRLGIPDLQMSDSVVGIAGMGGTGRYATALPSAEAMAAAWDPTLSAKIGDLLGRELRAFGFNMSLGAGVNMIREPRNGRVFEYLGEDPLLAGTLAASELRAEKSLHLITDVKHFVANDQDAGRTTANSAISRRALRESDLLAFEITLRESGAGAVMCAYNRINGNYACENHYTLTDVLKNKLGFKGFVLSDWGATQSTVKAALAGLDVEMPAGDSFGAPLKRAVLNGEVPLARIDDMVHRILRTEFDSGIVDDPPQPAAPDVLRGLAVAQETEERGAVLLRNEHNLLPLRAGAVRSIAVIGGHADAGVLCGGGSSQVSPAGGNAVLPSPNKTTDPLTGLAWSTYHRSVPLAAIRARASSATVRFNPGTDLAAAADLARSSDVAIVFALQPAAEGSDLKSLALPGPQDALIEAVSSANPHTIIVLETGGAVLMPWIDHVEATLEAWYPGIRGAEAITALLFGDVNPSGHLALTFPRNEADMPHPVHVNPPEPDSSHPIPSLPGFPPEVRDLMDVRHPFFDVAYDEGLLVGYKWYDARNKPVLFPFGFGLSYSAFSYSDLSVGRGDPLTVTFSVTNTGTRAGIETAQVYTSLPAAAAEPPNRLVGWSQVALEPGESKHVTIPVAYERLNIFDETTDSWLLLPGHYMIRVGSSSRDLRLQQPLTF
jgi:beta-glucosidase